MILEVTNFYLLVSMTQMLNEPKKNQIIYS